MTKEIDMPTSDSEAKKIKGIIDEFLTSEQAREITKRLDEEVGKNTDNDSLKVSLEMLRRMYEISS